MTATETQTLAIGTKVVDRDGFKGSISNITHHNGSFWYDVRFDRGSAVRFHEELTVVA